MNKLTVLILALLGSTSLFISAYAAPNAIQETAREKSSETSTPRGVVETIIEKARTLDSKASYAANTKTIESLVDFQKLSSDAIGDQAKNMTAAQKKEIQDLLRQIITRTVYPAAPKFFQDVKIDFTGEEPVDSRVHITSVVTKGAKRSTVEYWLSKQTGNWRVVDLAIEGERWVENVRDQFDEIIGKQGATGLIQKMRKRLATIKAKS